MSKIGVATQASSPEALLDADLDTLVTALYVKIDDGLVKDRRRGQPRRPGGRRRATAGTARRPGPATRSPPWPPAPPTRPASATRRPSPSYCRNCATPAGDAVTALADRPANAGMFDIFLKVSPYEASQATRSGASQTERHRKPGTGKS